MVSHGTPAYNEERELERLLTVGETCTILSVSRQTLYRLLARHELRASRVGTRLRFEPEYVRRYLDAHREP